MFDVGTADVPEAEKKGFDRKANAAAFRVDGAEQLQFGDYLLEEELAHGGMGVVYRARQLSLGRTVAVKMLLLGRYASAESIGRFQREALSAASLRHPNIVAVYDVGEAEGQHFFSMEFIDGQSLADLLRLGPLKPMRAAEYTHAIAKAIHYAHSQGVLHRDLKPSNVLIDPFDQVRITDFGLAKRLDGSSDLTVTGQMIGSPNYLSPEQAAGRQAEVGPASDVYAIGALLYELLTGRPPFLAESLTATLLQICSTEPVGPRALNPSIPRDLETICLKCLQKRCLARYSTAEALAGDLERFLQQRPILARPITPIARVAKWARRQPKLAGMLLMTAAAVAGLLFTLTAANLRIRSAQRQTATQAEEARQRLVRLNVAAGHKLIEEGDTFASLLWLVEALRLEQGDVLRENVHRRRIAAVLRHSPVLEQTWFHERPVAAAEFSSDGTRVLTGSDDGTLSIWDTDSGRRIGTPLKTGSRLLYAHFMPDQGHIVSLDASGQLRFWRAADGAPIESTFKLDALDTESPAFSPDGSWFLSPVSGRGAIV